MALVRTSLRGLLLSLLALASSGCERALFKYVNRGLAPPASSVVFDAGHGLALDVFPAQGATAAGGAPVVVFFYGGSWQRGERAQYRFVGRRLAENGILAIVADYRTWPRAGFPDFMADAAHAVAWAQAHARTLGGDPRRLYVAGHSAGAQIAALLGTDARYLAAADVRLRDMAGVIACPGRTTSPSAATWRRSSGHRRSGHARRRSISSMATSRLSCWCTATGIASSPRKTAGLLRSACERKTGRQPCCCCPAAATSPPSRRSTSPGARHGCCRPSSTSWTHRSAPHRSRCRNRTPPPGRASRRAVEQAMREDPCHRQKAGWRRRRPGAHAHGRAAWHLPSSTGPASAHGTFAYRTCGAVPRPSTIRVRRAWRATGSPAHSGGQPTGRVQCGDGGSWG